MIVIGLLIAAAFVNVALMFLVWATRFRRTLARAIVWTVFGIGACVLVNVFQDQAPQLELKVVVCGLLLTAVVWLPGALLALSAPLEPDASWRRKIVAIATSAALGALLLPFLILVHFVVLDRSLGF